MVRPQAQPQTPTKVDNPTSPIENVPSPYKPNQPNPPQIDPSKVIPPILAVGSTASISKIITDKINELPISEKYSNVEKYIGDKLSRSDSNNPAAIHPRLPDYDGKKTSGILVVNNEEIDIISGYDGPTALAKEKISGMNNILKAHVEAHVVVIMRQEGIKEAILYINQKPCLDIRGVGCETMLERMLPKGTKLTIIAPNGYKKTFEGK